MDDTRLWTLAVDIAEGRVFGSWMLPVDQVRLIHRVFMPLAVGGVDALPADVSCVYEYLDKAIPLQVEGHPVFLTCRYLTHANRERLLPMLVRYRRAKGQSLDPSGE